MMGRTDSRHHLSVVLNAGHSRDPSCGPLGMRRMIKATPHADCKVMSRFHGHDRDPAIIVDTEIQSDVENIMMVLGYGCDQYNLSFVEMDHDC